MDIKAFVWQRQKRLKKGSRSIAKHFSAKNAALMKMAEALKKTFEGTYKRKCQGPLLLQKRRGFQRPCCRLAFGMKTGQWNAPGLIEVASLPDPVGEVWRCGRGKRHDCREDARTDRRNRHYLWIAAECHSRRDKSLPQKLVMRWFLRGGSDGIHSNKALVKILRMFAKTEGIHEGAITFLDVPDREAVMEMLKLEGIHRPYNTQRRRGAHQGCYRKLPEYCA